MYLVFTFFVNFLEYIMSTTPIRFIKFLSMLFDVY